MAPKNLTDCKIAVPAEIFSISRSVHKKAIPMTPRAKFKVADLMIFRLSLRVLRLPKPDSLMSRGGMHFLAYLAGHPVSKLLRVRRFFLDDRRLN